MRYPRRLLSEGEEVVREFRPHWRMLFIPALWTVLAIAGTVAAFVLPPEDGTVDLITVGVILLLWLWFGLWRFIKWWFTWYVLTNERLVTRRGVIARQGTEIPLENINDIKFSQTVLERVLKSGDLLIESAGEMGQSRFSDIPEPEEFQSLLYQVREQRASELAGGGRVVGDDATAKLERLAALHRDGALTDEEFEEKKRQLLDEI